MFMSKEEEQVCCICGKKISGKGNDPWPLKKKADAVMNVIKK